MQHVRAETLEDAFWALDPFATVESGDPFHVDLSHYFSGPDYSLASFLGRYLGPAGRKRGWQHLGVIGFKGCGKTTQVRQYLNANLEVFPAQVDALGMLDQADFTFADFILVIVGRVLESLRIAGYRDLPREEATLVRQWFAETLVTEERGKEVIGMLETEAELGGSIPFLAKLAARFTSSIKGNTTYREEIRQHAMRDIDDLVRRANVLFDAAKRVLSEDGRQLLIVFDNLEKLPDRSQVARAVLQRAEQIRKLRCHLILFFDTSDQYTPHSVQPTAAFDTHIVPMLPVRLEQDAFSTVTDAMERATRELLDVRFNLDLLTEQTDDVVREIARLSGGRIREIFHLARKAVEYSEGPRITVDTVQCAARKLAGELVVAANPGQWPRLRDIHREKRAGGPDDGNLLQHGLVLNYNGTPWWDIHPFVALDPRFTQADRR